jgi:hypothetical protein
MTKLLSVSFFVLSLFGVDAPKAPPAKPAAIVPISIEDQQALYAAVSEFNAAQKNVQTLSEIVRLRSCLRANLTEAECGPWNQQGQVIRLPKKEAPNPAPAQAP